MTTEIENQKSKTIYPKYVSFDEEKFTLLLNIDKAMIDLNDIDQTAARNGFDKKPEFHITIIGFKVGAAIKQALDKLSGERKQEALQKIQSLIKNIDWGFTLLPQRYHIKKDYLSRTSAAVSTEHRESYIQMVSMPDMEKFYAALNNILSAHLELPLPHLTLYIRGDNPERAKAGIGINSQEEFLKLNPELLIL